MKQTMMQMPITVCELVTPERTMQYLEKNTGNRRLRVARRDEFVQMILNNTFHLTHQGIAFTVSGKLDDGQHRLWAIVITGKAQWMMVTRGLSEDAGRGTDRPALRTIGDELTRRNGIKNSNVVAAAINVITECILSGRIPKLQYDQYSTVLPLCETNIQLIFDCLKNFKPARNKSVYGILALASFGFESDALRFSEQLAKGENLEATDPILVFRNFLINGALSASTTRDLNLKLMKFTASAFTNSVSENKIRHLKISEAAIPFLVSKMPKETLDLIRSTCSRKVVEK